MQNLVDDSHNYTNFVDECILSALESGATHFDQLILALPSVYPSIVLNALQRLTQDGRIPSSIFAEALRQVRSKPEICFSQSHRSMLPVPHPLDFDWRFTHRAVSYLLNELVKLTDVNDCIALLGTPSILYQTVKQEYFRRFVLLDANTTITDYLSHIVPVTQVLHKDLTHDRLPLWRAKAVLIDPPWYTAYIQVFLWAAAQVCVVGGYILASVPPIGTRPGIQREWLMLLRWAEELGLVLVQLNETVLPYISPPFERNALSAEGIYTIPSEWRRGDLAVFMLREHTNTSRPSIALHKLEWIEETISGVRIAVRCQQKIDFEDPSLISIIPNDILSSVSMRDNRRERADVWTSGNRIFACQGGNILQQIINATSTRQSPLDAVATFLRRSLTSPERALVDKALYQVRQLVDIEQAELMMWGYASDNQK